MLFRTARSILKDDSEAEDALQDPYLLAYRALPKFRSEASLLPHTATAEAKGFDSREITEGRSWKLVVAKRGRFSYFCTLHRTMKGTLIVK